ncbi:putative peptidyl-tRNA hydrolase 2 [Apostichopus japonicus]|uniref:peptidyl-tRNA hydrolase n=2 Tax=Stichopus japonicus TaxID=307972 RepID=A0A2G8K2A2_STIJA|nr:putative peptidyl-tRNA hydrolase 2 [Apostichopus japonicus]
MLMAMGIDRELATQAVWVTGTTTADAALTWIFENRDSVEPSEERLPPDGALVEGDNVAKMVFVVNMDLKMGVGKVAAQVAHAAVGLHKFLLQNQEVYGHLLLLWDADGETKIVLKGDNITILEDLRRKSEAAGLPCYLVSDAGRTQVPMGSSTVFAIFGRVNEVDDITGQLKLL